MLRATDLGHSFGEQAVFEDLSIDVETGEVLAVIGPSGVGKTTLLRVLALSLEPNEGTITVDGRDVWRLDQSDRLSIRRRVGMVFQEASLFDTSVARNVEYGLRIRRSLTERLANELRSIPRSDGVPDPVRNALDIVGLTEKINQPAGSLSGGEAQRVSFARAVAYDPDILLLDEPTSDLDPRNTELIEEAVTEARNRDIGIVVATHDMHQARRVADRVAVLLGGTITEIGPRERIFEDPSDERTRKFISGELVY